MSARRCTLCGVNYPTLAQFTSCPIHEELTQYLANTEPDEDWMQSFELRRKWARADEELRQFVPLVRSVSVIEDAGQLYVDQIELQRAGLRLSRMQPDQFYMFELEDGWIYETQGWDNPRRRWWVERVIESEQREPDLARDLGLSD